MAACRNWCCELTGTTTTGRKRTICGSGVIVQFHGDFNCSSLPGLKKAGDHDEPETNYALLTCHSTISGSAKCFRDVSWSMKCAATGVEKCPKINAFVSGVVSCCGEKSLFKFGGEPRNELVEHLQGSGPGCELGLNFTLVFLNKKFSAFIKSNVSKGSPPQVHIPQNESHLVSLSKIVESQECDVARKQSAPEEKREVTGSLSICLPNADTPDVAIMLNNTKRFPGVGDSKLISLEHDIAKYETLLRINYICAQASSTLVPGLPIMYQSKGGSAELVGIHLEQRRDGSCVGITMYGIVKLLQGGPVSCLSVLAKPAANRLWVNRWAYLILPYLGKPLDVKRALEILHMFLKNRLLKTHKRDPTTTREAVLNLVGVLFCHFEGVSQEDLTAAMEDVLGQSKKEFLDNVSSLCRSVVDVVKDTCHYERMIQLAEACFHCVIMMFNFNDREGVVVGVLKCEEFLETLEDLGAKYGDTASIQRSVASIRFYKKCHQDSQRSLQQLETEHKKELVKLQTGHAQQVKQLEERIQKQQENLQRKDKECKNSLQLVKQEGASKAAAEKKNQHLERELQQKEQLLSSEAAARERFSRELEEERARNAEYCRELAELSGKDNQSFKDNVSTVKEQVSTLQRTIEQQAESGHAMQSELTKLSNRIHVLTQQLRESEEKRKDLEQSKDHLRQQVQMLTTQLADKHPQPVRQKHVSESAVAFATPPRARQAKTRRTSTPSSLGAAVHSSDGKAAPKASRKVISSARRKVGASESEPPKEKPTEGIHRSGSDPVVTRHATRRTA